MKSFPSSPLRFDLGAFVPSMCSVVYCSFFLFLYCTLHISTQLAIFRCTGCYVKESAAYCNVIFFPPTEVASSYFGYVGYRQFYLDVLGLHVVAFL
jgi:hypothetical protein